MAINPLTIGAGLLILGVPAIYVALKRPLYFPFGLYVLLVPLDGLLVVGSAGTVAKLLGMASGALLLFWMFRRRAAMPLPKTAGILAILVLWMLASTLWAIDQHTALQIMPTYGGLILLYVALTMMPVTKSQFRILLGLVVLGGLCAAAYGAYMFYRDPSLAQQAETGGRLVLQGTVEGGFDSNGFADSLLLPAAIVTMWTLRTNRFSIKFLGICGLVLLTIAVLLSGSRAGLIAFGLILVYYAWRSRYRVQLAITAGALAVAALSVQSAVWSRFATVLATGGSGRTSIWAVGLEAAKHHPLQGYGVGNFPAAFDLFYLSVHQPYPYGYDSPAHNVALHYFVELGVIGFAMIAYFFWLNFRSLRDIGKTSDLYDYRIAMEATLVALIFVSMTIDLFTAKYAWLIFSMVALLRNAYLTAAYEHPGTKTSPRNFVAPLQRISARAAP
jgi:O-antigen ligase